MEENEDTRRRMDRLGARLTRRTRVAVLKILTIVMLCLAVLPFAGGALGIWSIHRETLWVSLVLLSYSVAAKILWDQESDLRFLFDHPELIALWKRRNSDQRES
jgi:hypothetical protein